MLARNQDIEDAMNSVCVMEDNKRISTRPQCWEGTAVRAATTSSSWAGAIAALPTPASPTPTTATICRASWLRSLKLPIHTRAEQIAMRTGHSSDLCLSIIPTATIGAIHAKAEVVQSSTPCAISHMVQYVPRIRPKRVVDSKPASWTTSTHTWRS